LAFETRLKGDDAFELVVMRTWRFFIYFVLTQNTDLLLRVTLFLFAPNRENQPSGGFIFVGGSRKFHCTVTDCVIDYTVFKISAYTIWNYHFIFGCPVSTLIAFKIFAHISW